MNRRFNRGRTPMCAVSLNDNEGTAVMMRSRNIIATALLLCTSLAAFSRAVQGSLDGQWERVLSRQGSEAKVSLRFKDVKGSLEGTMTMLSVGMFRQPLTTFLLIHPKCILSRKTCGGFRR
jgi:hypothetical protein